MVNALHGDVIPLVPDGYSQRLKQRQSSSLQDVWDLLDEVKDPEIPVISIWDLGILIDVCETDNEGTINIFITPTYSGCPAMDAIREDIDNVLQRNHVTDYEVITRLAPAWTTDWMSPEGRAQLRAYGIAPPQNTQCAVNTETPSEGIECPNCQSSQTRLISEFGSTACKALYRCSACQEPFDYFKCL